MTESFREQVHHDWRMRQLNQTLTDIRELCRTIDYDLRTLPLRPPCRICGQWPCVCNKENN
jgi:hypothetical protein